MHDTNVLIAKLIGIDALRQSTHYVNNALQIANAKLKAHPTFANRQWAEKLYKSLGHLYIAQVETESGGVPSFYGAGWLRTVETVLRAQLVRMDHRLGKDAIHDDTRNRLRAHVMFFEAVRTSREGFTVTDGSIAEVNPRQSRRLSKHA